MSDTKDIQVLGALRWTCSAGNNLLLLYRIHHQSKTIDVVLYYIQDHAYTVISVIGHYSKRFLRIRNPRSDSGWKGRWSHGSKEWTEGWLNAFKAFGHVFGDDVIFVMEYEDFLNIWTSIERTQLFDVSRR